ncbi:MAG TPA: geranylgeranyl reductase family protein [Actinomycetota bacterium]|nr:geranylgeranyl reductase family protein [Actinomycetota bacterium]
MLVVGAGPAGSAAAYHLARAGLDVLLADRATFPREKVCGDGLTPRGVRAMMRMGVDPAEPGFTRVEGLRTYGVGGTVLDLRWPREGPFPPVGVVRTRLELDHLLAARAERAGARFLQGAEATRPLLDRTGWVSGAELRTQDGALAVRSRFVVAADGAASRFAAQAGVVRDGSCPMGVAARRYYRIPRPQQAVLEAFVNLPAPGGGVMAGYGWIFPLGGDLVNVGAGLLNTYRGFGALSARALLESFVRGLPEAWGVTEERAVGPVRSGPIPMGFNRRPVAVPGLLLVGDAAGATNPFNGEGIAYAIETGELAAELIAEAVARGRPALAQLYPTVLRQRYGKYYFVGRQWSRMIGHPWFMGLAVRHGFPRRTLMRFALSFMANLVDGDRSSLSGRLARALVALAPEG